MAAKYRAVNGAWKVVDRCLDLLGGFSIFKQAGVERMWHDRRPLRPDSPGQHQAGYQLRRNAPLGLMAR
ncbi:MAG: hypothetical protein ACE5Q6_18985 [Dehalococcoidia bacterium]